MLQKSFEIVLQILDWSLIWQTYNLGIHFLNSKFLLLQQALNLMVLVLKLCILFNMTHQFYFQLLVFSLQYFNESGCIQRRFFRSIAFFEFYLRMLLSLIWLSIYPFENLVFGEIKGTRAVEDWLTIIDWRKI